MNQCSIATLSIALALSFLLASTTSAQTLEQQLLAEPANSLAVAARTEGDAVRGGMVFHHSAVTCVACHSVGDRPAAIGPDLTKIDRKTTDASIVESLLDPSKVIAPAYAMVAIETTDGVTIRGVPVEDIPAKLVLRDAAQPQKLITLKPTEIASRQATTQSIMPTGQVNLLANRGQFLDLVRYLIELRDGGVDRARAIERSLATIVQEFPDKPSPFRPVVQRGEIALPNDAKYPRGVAMGFVGGTVLFDADQLCPVALWSEGFVKSSPQSYFGLYWQSAGAAPQTFAASPHPLAIKLPGQDNWQSFEPPLVSDPNTGTRFDGVQIGRDSVRLEYHVFAAGHRIRVTEDIRAETRAAWQGYSRVLHFTDIPAGAMIALEMPAGKSHWQADHDGKRVSTTNDARQAPLLGYQSGKETWVAVARSQSVARWQADESNRGDKEPKQHPRWRLVTAAASDNKQADLRVDLWKYLGADSAIESVKLKELSAQPPAMNDKFDAPLAPASLPPALLTADEPKEPTTPPRPAVNSKENTDEFAPTTGRFLRFTITGSSDQSEPGIDELEIYGADDKVNLALQGKATASSVIPGYAIHQIKHLNDGRLGNPHSWISAEKSGGWAQIELAAPVEMRKIVWARDRTGTCQDRVIAKYRIEISSDGREWKKVGDESGRATIAGAGAIVRNAAPAYVMESIPLPFAGCRPSDVAFSADGRTMYAIAMTEGQIWRTQTPPIEHPTRVRWQRYATGLYHPIGLALIGDRLFVSQKPEITELIDRDGDGVVDQYRTVATGWGLSTGWHEYCFGLVADHEKNLWFTLNTGYFWTNPGFVNPGRWRGSVMRVSTTTGVMEQVAKGCRVPNGVCSGPAEELFFTDNQGDWIQVCKLAHIVKGRFYGHPEYKEDALTREQAPTGRSAIWFPYDRMRSISGPIRDTTAGKFGPFADQLFVGDVGYGANAGIMRVALEQVDGEYQGACFPFVDNQPLGCERLRFGPDNALYAASLTSGLTRLSYVGTTAPLAMQSIRIRPGGQGFVVQFTKPLAPNQSISAQQFAVKRYHYLYTGNYGSPIADEKPVAVTAAELSPDRTSITLSLSVETYPIGMVYEFRLPKLADERGAELQQNQAWYTVQRIPK